MIHGTTCRFCKRPITPEIDDNYSGLGDPYKILPMACCNFCSDIRVERRVVEEKIQRACRALSSLSVSDTKGRDNMRALLEKLTKKYARMIARWYGNEGSLWDEGVLEVLMKQPNQWPDALGKLWSSFRHWQQQQQRDLTLDGK